MDLSQEELCSHRGDVRQKEGIWRHEGCGCVLWDVDPHALPQRECPKNRGLEGYNRRIECVEVKYFSMNGNRKNPWTPVEWHYVQVKGNVYFVYLSVT